VRSITILAFVAVTSACATHRPAILAERMLAEGSDAWGEHVDDVILGCRERALPTPAERAACVEPTRTIDATIVAPAIIAAVVALRAYWAAEDDDGRSRALARFARAVATLPADYWGTP